MALPPVPLVGLVLAGGSSRRMGTDKSGLRFHGRTQLEHCFDLLGGFCEVVRVSTKATNAGREPYTGFPLIFDTGPVDGPAAGLLAAWREFPGHALLVLAVDMPGVDARILDHLTAHRDAGKAASAFRHADGVIEPLCAIWEPRAAGQIEAAAVADLAPSLSRILAAADVAWLVPPEPGRLESVNTPSAAAKAGGIPRNRKSQI